MERRKIEGRIKWRITKPSRLVTKVSKEAKGIRGKKKAQNAINRKKKTVPSVQGKLQ